MKNKKQNIATFFLLVVFTLPSIGISYSAPCCDKVQAITKCCIEEVQQKENCCEDEVKKEKHICQNHCDGLCFTTYSYSKLDVDQIAIEKKLFSPIIVAKYFFLEDNTKSNEINFSDSPINSWPLNLWGRSLIYSLNKPKIPYLVIV